jgi:hypothetical protein
MSKKGSRLRDHSEVKCHRWEKLAEKRNLCLNRIISHLAEGGGGTVAVDPHLPSAICTKCR